MRRRKFIALLSGAAAWWPFSPAVQDITGVAVSDAEFRPVRTLTSAEDLAAFSALWATRVTERGKTAVQGDYKINISSGGRSVRWIYDPAGLAQALSIKRTAVYRLPSPAAFNALLGIQSR